MSIRLLVKFTVKEGMADTFVDIMRGAVAQILAAPGCEGVEVLQGEEQPSVVMLSETWVSREIHDRYAAQMAEAGSMEKLAPLLAGEVETSFFLIR